MCERNKEAFMGLLFDEAGSKNINGTLGQPLVIVTSNTSTSALIASLWKNPLQKLCLSAQYTVPASSISSGVAGKVQADV